MITHLVMFRFNDKGDIGKVRELLEGLEGIVPQLRSIEVGVNIVDSPRAYDMVLQTTFDSLEDLQAYQVHPTHVEAATYIRSVIDASASVDYER